MTENANTKNGDSNIGEIKEFGLTLSVCLKSTTPRKTSLYYDKELQLERLLITNLLSQYVQCGKSVLNPVKCLDANGGAGINGLLWKKYLPDNSINVYVTTQHPTAVKTIQANAERNGLNISVVNKDVCVLLHEESFNFIHIDCHTSASYYFDAAFKNLPRNGVLVITTKDDCSLHGRNPNAAVRNYGGYIGKTMYNSELGIRLVIAAMTRSAAKYNKAIEVICCAAFKSSFVVAVTIGKGSIKTDNALENIRRLMLCKLCEQWTFYPTSDDGSVVDNSNLVNCLCHTGVKDNSIIISAVYGPIWSGEIFNVDYLTAMMKHNNIPSRELLNSFISLLLSESMVTNYPRTEISKNEESESPPNKKMKSDDENISEENSNTNNPGAFAENNLNKTGYLPDGTGDRSQMGISLQKQSRGSPRFLLQNSEDCITSPFYYNLPLCTPKIPHQVPIDKVITGLIKDGFRASRTHFDRESIRTNATCRQLVAVIEGLSKKT